MRGWGIGTLLAVLVGCTNLNYQNVGNLPLPPETPESARTTIRLVDARPKWEQRPFRDAMALYAISDIGPSVWDQIRVAVVAVACEVPERPDRIEVTVRSIQLVAKDSARVARETEDRRFFRNEPSDDAGPTSLLLSLLVGVPLEYLVNAPLAKHYPAALWKAPEGTSCSIRADVALTWPDGRKKTIPVAGLSTTAWPGDPEEPRISLAEAFRLAMFQLQDQLRKGLGVPQPP